MDRKMWYNEVRKSFKEDTYNDVLTKNHIQGSECAVKFDGVEYQGFKLKKDLFTYFIETHVAKDLPIKATDIETFSYRSDVFRFVKRYQSVRIKADQRMGFRRLVDEFNHFNHTSPDDWLLARIIAIGGYVTRLNVRLITEQGFGKDSLVNSIIESTDNGSNIYNVNIAKLEYELRNEYIVTNEISTTSKEVKQVLEQFFLEAGAFSNTYLARSRAVSGGAGKKEIYDISKTSIIALQNTPQYYLENNKDLFEYIFTRAVYHRFLPLFFGGHVQESFHESYDARGVLDAGKSEMFDWLLTLYHYRENEEVQPLNSGYEFSEEELRFRINFERISRLIEWYCEGDSSLQKRLTDRLYESYQSYKKLLVELGVFE